MVSLFRLSACLWLCLISFLSGNCHAWNAMGHRVIAQIAYDHLSPKAKAMCHRYLRSRASKPLRISFVAAATWMDFIKTKGIHRYNAMHYIDIPFSTDGSRLPTIKHTNAVRGIKNAILIFSSKKANVSKKRLALRMLIHLVGDVHQPLHTVTRVSFQLPKGDLGGNLFPLGKNAVGTHLHQYWDNGAGLFMGQYKANRIRNTASELEKKWPCTQVAVQTNPEQWAQNSYNIALKEAYQINPKSIPSNAYQLNAQNLIEKQASFAGCRLAALLNKVAL